MRSEDFQELKKTVPQVKQEIEKLLKKLPENRNIVLGVTGSGKSSLISFLNGAKLSAKKVKLSYHIQNEAPNTKHPQIGNKKQSCTFLPGHYGEYIDSAGFLDSNGVIREIVNSYAMARLFEENQKMKIIIVLEFASLINGRGETLIEVANRLAKLFPDDYMKLIDSIVLVCSKVDPENELEDILEEMKEILSLNKNISEPGKMLMKTIIEFQRVRIFPIPKENALSDSKRKQIQSCIQNNINYCMLSKNASISLSSQAELQIGELVEDLMEDFERLSEQINNFLRSTYKKKYGDKNKISEIQVKLIAARHILQRKDRIDILIQKFIGEIHLENELGKEIIKFYDNMNFCYLISKPKKIQMHSINNMINCLRQIEIQLNGELHEIAMKEQIEAIKKQNQEIVAQKDKQLEEIIKALTAKLIIQQIQHQSQLKRNQQQYQKRFKKTDPRHQAEMNELNRTLMQKQLLQEVEQRDRGCPIF